MNICKYIHVLNMLKKPNTTHPQVELCISFRHRLPRWNIITGANTADPLRSVHFIAGSWRDGKS